MNKENWERLEAKTDNIFFQEKLLIDKDIITVRFTIGKKTNLYTVFINGSIKGDETQENQEKYWSEKRKLLSKKYKEYLQWKIKNGDKEEKEKYKAELEKGVIYSWYSPNFSSFKALMRVYKKRHKEIYWIPKENL